MTTRTGSEYHVESKIGSGGFGAVYRARMTTEGGLERRVALKVLHPDQASQPEIARLRDEAKLLAMLNHRAIVQVVDLVQLKIGWTVVMELVEGLDLSQLRQLATFPPRPAIEVVGEVASALHEAWTTNPGQGPLHLVHRDIKPANLKLSHTGEVKVLDFGIASAARFEREAQTATNEVVGTVRYMAPERFEGRTGPECDVYALGVVLAELLGQRTAGPMHDGRRFEQTLRSVRHLAGPEIATLLEKMLAYDPEERPTALEVARECRRLAARVSGPALADWALDLVPELTEELPKGDLDDPLVGATLTATRRIPTGPKRSLLPQLMVGGLLVAVAATGAFLLGSVVTGSAVWVGRSGPVEPLVLQRMTELEDVPADARGLALSPDGTVLAYQSGGEVYVHPIGGRPRNVTDMVKPETGWPVFSPDGDRLAYTVEGEGVWISTLDGEVLERIDLQAEPSDWGPTLLTLSNAPASVLHTVTDGRAEVLGEGETWRTARWHPDGKRILVTTKAGLVWVHGDGRIEPLGFEAWTADTSHDGDSIVYTDFDGTESRLFVKEGDRAPHQESHLDGRIDDVAAARDVPRMAIGNRIRRTRFRLVEVAPRRHKVLEERVLPLPDDLIAAGLMPDGNSLMWVETKEDRSPGSREIRWNETLWLATLDGEKTRQLAELQSVYTTTAGMTADHYTQYLFQERTPGNGRVVAVDLRGEAEVRPIVGLKPNLFGSLWVSPSGDRIALTDHEGHLFVLPTDAAIDSLPPAQTTDGWEAIGWTIDESGVLGLHRDGRLAVFDAGSLDSKVLAHDIEDAVAVPGDRMILQRAHALSWFSPFSRKEWPMLEVTADRFVMEPTPDGRFVLVTELENIRHTWIADFRRD